jgi:membrane associated rhomboid family serine protease
LTPQRGVITLLAVYLASWALINLGGEPVQAFVSRHLLLTPRHAIGLEPWQLVTNAFVIDDLESVFFLSITLIFFGNAVERLLGAGRLWKIYIAGIFGGSLLWALFARALWPDLTIAVTSAAGTAVLVAYAAQLSRQQVSLFGGAPVSGGMIAWIWIGIAVIGALFRVAKGHWLSALVDIVGMLGGGIAGWLMVRGGSLGLGGIKDTLDRVKMWRLRRRYKVISGGRSSDDKSYLN